MALEPLKEREIKAIVNSVNKVLATRDISHLTKQAYNFLYLCSGFIAHFNHQGFMCAYENVNELQEDLERNYRANMWLNFRPGEENYEYYKSKAEVYKRFKINPNKSDSNFMAW